MGSVEHMHYSDGGAKPNDVGHEPSVKVHATLTRVIPEGRKQTFTCAGAIHSTFTFE